METQSKSFHRRPYREFNKFPSKTALTAQIGVQGAIPDDNKTKWEDKLATLRAQRLCMNCGEKWGRNHKCPDKIALHVLEEYLELLYEDSLAKSESSSDKSSDREIFSLSHCATIGIQGKKTIRLNAKVQD